MYDIIASERVGLQKVIDASPCYPCVKSIRLVQSSQRLKILIVSRLLSETYVYMIVHTKLSN